MAGEQYLKSMEDDKILGPFNTEQKDNHQQKKLADLLKGRSSAQYEDDHGNTGNNKPSVLYATIAGVAIAGPLFVMMKLILFVSISTLLISSPLFLLFSPILVPAGLVLVATMIGFAVSALMALAGLHMFCLSYNSFLRSTLSSSVRLSIINGGDGFTEKINETLNGIRTESEGTS